MKVDKNCEQPFIKDNNTYYVQNTEDNRSRKGTWNFKKFVRSDSRQGYFRTGSKNTYMRDNSRFSRQGSSFRYNSRPGSINRKGSNIGSGSLVKQGGTPRSQSKSLERPKSEMFKKVENLEKEIKEIL